MDTIPKVPDGYRRFKGDGKTEFIDGSLVRSGDRWIEGGGTGSGCFAPDDCAIPLSVTPGGHPIPEGWELIKVGEGIPQGCRGCSKTNPVTAEWIPLPGNEGQRVEPQDGCWYIRRKPAPAPAVEEAKCPACGNGMEFVNTAVACRTDGCPFEGVWLLAEFVARIRIDPEPLVCPRCGSVASSCGTNPRVLCKKCLLSGPQMDTEAEAIAEFRKLSYHAEEK